jgi:hypothetical protein
MSISLPASETEQVVLTLPSALVRSAKLVATRTQRSLETVLAEWLDRAAAELPVEALDDASLLALCELRLSSAEQAELDALLAANREGDLDEAGKSRLDACMQAYDLQLLRKSQALREAVARGLREPLAA